MKHPMFLLLVVSSIGAFLLSPTVRGADVPHKTEKSDATRKAVALIAGHYNLSLLSHLFSLFWYGTSAMAPAIQDLLYHECINREDGQFDASKPAKFVDEIFGGEKQSLWPNLVHTLISSEYIGHELGDVLKANYGSDTTDSKIVEKINTIRNIQGVGPSKGTIALILQLINGQAVFPPHQNMPPAGGPAPARYPAENYA